MSQPHELDQRRHAVRLLFVCLLATLSLCACSTFTPDTNDPRAAAQVSFEVLEGKIGEGEFRLVPQEDSRSGGIRITLAADSAQQLKAVYGRLHYDASKFEFSRIRPSAAWGDANRVLLLGLEREPGVADLGIVLANYDQRAGLNGRVELGQIELRPRGTVVAASICPLEAKQRGSSSGLGNSPEGLDAFPPEPQTSFTLDYSIDRHLAELSWSYELPGDYDQNGEVAVNDLSPLGLHFGESMDIQDNWDKDSIQSVVDGDNNGEIGLSDLVPIGRNYSIMVGGWDAFYKGSLTDHDYSAANSLGHTAFEAAEGNAALERLHFQFALSEVLPSPFYRLVVSSNGSQAALGRIPFEPGSHPVRYYHLPPAGTHWYGLSWNPGEARLEYGSQLPGDGDANGIVNISDATPIGANFGAVWDKPFSKVWVADYNRDGAVNIFDMDIIGFNNYARCDGFLFYATFNPAELPEPYSYPLLDPVDPTSVQSGQYVWLRPYVGDPADPLNIGAPSQVIQIP